MCVVLVLPLTSCVTLGWLLHLSEPASPHLQNQGILACKYIKFLAYSKTLLNVLNKCSDILIKTCSQDQS